MTTPEFIKLIKACKDGRNKVHGLNWKSSDPSYIISESELDKIEKVNVELLKVCQKAMESEIDGSYITATKWWNEMKQAIKNASNIKQI